MHAAGLHRHQALRTSAISVVRDFKSDPPRASSGIHVFLKRVGAQVENRQASNYEVSLGEPLIATLYAVRTVRAVDRTVCCHLTAGGNYDQLGRRRTRTPHGGRTGPSVTSVSITRFGVDPGVLISPGMTGRHGCCGQKAGPVDHNSGVEDIDCAGVSSR